MFYARIWMGRAVMHLGLQIMPPSRTRSELFALMDQWSTKVQEAIRREP